MMTLNFSTVQKENQMLRERIAQLENELKSSREQLYQSHKLETLGRLAGSVAHDFNNLLTLILNYTELIELELVNETLVREGLEQIKEVVTRASGLTRHLALFNRQQITEPHILDINETVVDIARMLERLIGKNIAFELRVSPVKLLVLLDPVQLEQVIMNLIINARDAMPGGGRLLVETSEIFLDGSTHDWPHPAQAGVYAALTISDTGCGMDSQVQARIFEPFFTTKTPDKGTGLGLATVHTIVKQAGGHISVSSKPGSGTTFKIYLPLAGTNRPVSQGEAAGQLIKGGCENIVLVEDDEVVRNLAARILTRYGYNVLLAQNGREALELCQRQDTPVDLVITDLMMPELGGQELYHRLMKSQPGLRFLFLSGYSGEYLQDTNSDNLPLACFLEKPFSSKGLLAKVRQVLDNR